MIKKFFEGISVKLFSIILILTIMWGLFQSYFTAMLSIITSTQLEKNIFLNAIIFFIVYIIFWAITEYANEVLIGNFCIKIGNNIYSTYFKKLYNVKPKKTQDINTGYIAGLLMQMVELKKNAIFKLITALISIVYITYIIFYISKYSYVFSFTIFFIISLSIIVLILSGILTRRKLKILTIERAQQVNLFMDIISNISTIQKFEAEDFINKKISISNENTLSSNNKFILQLQAFLSLYKILNYMIFPVCILLVFSLNLQNELHMVEFLSYLSVATVLLVNKVNMISEAIKDTFVWSASQKKLDSMFDNTLKDDRVLFTETVEKIAIKNALYAYNDSIVIKIPSFVINKGQFVCIAGESGQGKTTLLKIISGILEIKNKILINGIPINKKIDMIYVAQDIEILDMTLRENLTFGDKNISDYDLIEIIDQIGMSEWYLKQKDGLDTKLGEKGVFVSSGQRQRLNIARGLLKEKEIYLFDEPTSNIDVRSKKLIIDLFKKRLSGKTVVFVTHDNLFDEICDRKYILKNNIIKELL